MADEQYTFTQARSRLEEIVTQVRRKDVSLEKSLDLLEEGVRLANSCTELIDHTEWRTVAAEQAGLEAEGAEQADPSDAALAAEEVLGENEAAAELEQMAEPADDEALVADVVEVTVVELEDGEEAIVEVTEYEVFADADAAWPDELADEPDADEDLDEPDRV